MKPTKKFFKVLHDDGHNDPVVHVFSSAQKFFAYMDGEESIDGGMFDSQTFMDTGEFTDGNGDRWSEFTGHREVDHTQDK